MDFLKMIIENLASDGYSAWFAIAFAIACVPLAIDVIRNGWTIEEDAE
jgi:hypothetical protein